MFRLLTLCCIILSFHTLAGKFGDTNDLPLQVTSSAWQNKDSLDTPKQDSTGTYHYEKEIKHSKANKSKKPMPRLVWTGWKTGFHWSTPRKR